MRVEVRVQVPATQVTSTSLTVAWLARATAFTSASGSGVDQATALLGPTGPVQQVVSLRVPSRILRVKSASPGAAEKRSTSGPRPGSRGVHRRAQPRRRRLVGVGRIVLALWAAPTGLVMAVRARSIEALATLSARQRPSACQPVGGHAEWIGDGIADSAGHLVRQLDELLGHRGGTG